MFLDSTFSGAQPAPGDNPPARSDNNSVDDVFDLTGTAAAAAGVSEIPRLRAEHGTAGYREGLSAGKATTVQAGFDEGYSLGAVVGLRAGAVLGVLEALCAAAEAGGGGGDGGEQARVRALCGRAAGELATASVFGPEWWGADGVWKFPVRGDDEGDALTFADVAAAHPLIAKWEAVLRDEARRWGVDLRVLDAGDAQTVGGDGPAGGGANALEW